MKVNIVIFASLLSVSFATQLWGIRTSYNTHPLLFRIILFCEGILLGIASTSIIIELLPIQREKISLQEYRVLIGLIALLWGYGWAFAFPGGWKNYVKKRTLPKK